MEPCKEFSEDTENEKESISGIRDDEVGKYGMCMGTAVTKNPENAEIIPDRHTITKINDIPAIVGMDAAVSFRTAYGTGLKFGTKLFHKRIKNEFR